MNYYTVLVRNIFYSDKNLSPYLVVESDRLHFSFDTFGGQYDVHRANMVKAEYDKWLATDAKRFVSPNATGPQTQHTRDPKSDRSGRGLTLVEPSDGVREPPVFCRTACTCCPDRGASRSPRACTCPV